MRLYFGVHWSVFVEAGISPHLIFLTAGELGISQDSTIQPMEMAIIRRDEAVQAAEFLSASVTILSFPDLRLPFVPMEELVASVLPIIRTKSVDAVFSFDPYETTYLFDHPDHNIAGLVAKHVGAAADVRHFMPESEALAKRPELYLWTSDSNKATHVVSLDSERTARRNEYLIQHYPSQFQRENQADWEIIFDEISESYIKVR